MPIDGERCEVAHRLRYVAEHGAPEWATTACCIAECIGEDDYPLWSGSGLLFSKLADLIEPTVETCEADMTDVIDARVVVREYECSKCGMSWETVWAYDFTYCPYCGRRVNHADE